MPPTRDGVQVKYLALDLVPPLRKFARRNRLDGRNPHFRHHFYDAFIDGFVVTLDRLVIRNALEHAFVDHVVETLVGQVRVDGLHSVPEQKTK